MISKEFTIKNKMGFHMRPASLFVTAMSKYLSDVDIIHNGNRIDGKSMMHIMTACIKCDSKITIECDGADEKEMMEEVSQLIQSRFEE